MAMFASLLYKHVLTCTENLLYMRYRICTFKKERERERLRPGKKRQELLVCNILDSSYRCQSNLVKTVLLKSVHDYKFQADVFSKSVNLSFY
jgi:hypothetical protein